METIVEILAHKYDALRPILDERARRLWVASEARAIGRGGIARVSEAAGMSRITVRTGLDELLSTPDSTGLERTATSKLRRAGAGRKRSTERDLELVAALESQLEPTTRGDPENPLCWTCLSAVNLSEYLTANGHPVSERTVNRLLNERGYSLQSNRKTLEGSQHPDRNAQFHHINRRVRAFQKMGQPVVSVDTKKKEVVGQFHNRGKQWRAKGNPEEVKVHDFPDPRWGKAVPYGIYDITDNSGWVSVGIDHDTASFAVHTLRRWWQEMGRPLYPQAKRLLVSADGGTSNSSRSRLWKLEIQQLADELGLIISICHFPPGTSKWNKIEHRMFCHITHNWRGRPLISYQAIVQLIAATRTNNGLSIRSDIDHNEYPLGVKASDQQMQELAIHHDPFHGEWNYAFSPRVNT